MGRRKKVPEQVHREAIALAAGQLFTKKGIQAVTMDEIAEKAGYSKATLYVYFKNKEALIRFLVGQSMDGLFGRLRDALKTDAPYYERYLEVCRSLASYQRDYPLYFELSLGEIRLFSGNMNGGIDVKDSQRDRAENHPIYYAEPTAFDRGEEINRLLSDFLKAGVRDGEFRGGLPPLPTVFLLWSALSGLLQMSYSKQAYLEPLLQINREEFLEYGFQEIYRLISVDGRPEPAHKNALRKES